MKISSILVTLGLAFAGTVAAAPWELSLGLVHRTVGDFEIASGGFNSPAFPDSGYVTGSLDAGSLVTVLDPPRQSNVLGTVVALHSIDFAGDDEGMDLTPGVLLAARTVLGERWGRTWELSLNAMWFGADTDSAGTVQGTTELFGVIVWDPFSIDPNSALVGAPVPPGTTLSDVYGTYDLDLDLDAFTFGLGIGTDVALPIGSVRLEAGPSLTVVDYDEQASYAAYWSSDGATVYQSRISDSGVKFLPGVYGDLSFAYDFNERIGMGLGVRYDFMFEKLETDLGELDLSGFSAMLKVQVRF